MAKSKSTSKNDPRSPFNWHLNREPSIFAKDADFRPRSAGLSNSEVQSQVVSKRKEKLDQILAYKHFGTFTRAKASIKHPNKHES